MDSWRRSSGTRGLGPRDHTWKHVQSEVHEGDCSPLRGASSPHTPCTSLSHARGCGGRCPVCTFRAAPLSAGSRALCPAVSPPWGLSAVPSSFLGMEPRCSGCGARACAGKHCWRRERPAVGTGSGTRAAQAAAGEPGSWREPHAGGRKPGGVGRLAVVRSPRPTRRLCCDGSSGFRGERGLGLSASSEPGNPRFPARAWAPRRLSCCGHRRAWRRACGWRWCRCGCRLDHAIPVFPSCPKGRVGGNREQNLDDRNQETKRHAKCLEHETHVSFLHVYVLSPGRWWRGGSGCGASHGAPRDPLKTVLSRRALARPLVLQVLQVP